MDGDARRLWVYHFNVCGVHFTFIGGFDRVFRISESLYSVRTNKEVENSEFLLIRDSCGI